MALTAEQITAVKDETAKYPKGTSPNVIADALNQEDGTEYMVVPLSDGRINISKLVLLTYLTAPQRAGLRAMLAGESEAEKDFAMLYNADDVFSTNDPVFRSMVDALAATLSIDASVVSAIKRIGERPKKRSEELAGRLLTANDIREALK